MRRDARNICQKQSANIYFYTPCPPFSTGLGGKLTTTRAILPINQRRVRGDAVVPDDDGVGLPLDTAVQVLAVGQMVVQELEQVVALLLLEADDVPRELRVDVQGLLAGGRVGADEGMDLLKGGKGQSVWG